MKHIIRILIFVLSVCTCPIVFGQSYSVKDVDITSAKFDRIYQRCSSAQLSEDTNNSPSNFITLKVFQNIEDSKYLVHNGNVVYMIELPGKKIADDEIITIEAVETDDIYQYLSAIGGAKKSVKILKLQKTAKPTVITKNEFLRRLMAGESFKVPNGKEKIRCKECNGFRRITDTQSGGRSADGKIECPSCNGSGGEIVDKFLLIHW